MRIGIDATALPPRPVGAGNYIINLIRSLEAQARNDEIVVFAESHGRDLIGVPPRQGFEWVTVPEMHPAVRLIWEQTIFPGLVRSAKVELLHSLHYTRPVRLGCASVVTLLDMTFFLYPQLHTRAKRLYFPRIIRMSARRADAFAAISESTRKDAIRLLKIPPEKILTTPLGVDRSFHLIEDERLLEEVRHRYDLPEKFVLYVGLIEPRKNLPLLIRAYRRLTAQETPYDLVLAGRLGWNYNEVLQSIERFGLRNRVRMPGYIPQGDLPLVYNLASLFIYPTTYEGFGLPVLEAMACGVPIITTRVSSLPEIVGKAGELLPENDEAALLKAMLRLLIDSELREKRKIAGFEQAAKFIWERTARLTLQLYRKAIQISRTP